MRRPCSGRTASLWVLVMAFTGVDTARAADGANANAAAGLGSSMPLAILCGVALGVVLAVIRIRSGPSR